MAYKTESEIIKHLCNNLLPRIIKKYRNLLTIKEYRILLNARNILIKLARNIKKKK